MMARRAALKVCAGAAGVALATIVSGGFRFRSALTGRLRLQDCRDADR
jgi:hypothetical protein